MTGFLSKRRMAQDRFRQYVVICSECSSEHDTVEVEVLNVEENLYGQDVVYFLCPETSTEAKSLVYAK